MTQRLGLLLAGLALAGCADVSFLSSQEGDAPTDVAQIGSSGMATEIEGADNVSAPSMASEPITEAAPGSSLARCVQLARAGDSNGAYALCDSILEDDGLSDRDRAVALTARGEARSTDGDLDGALNDIRSAVRLDQTYPRGFAAAAAVYRKQGENRRALLNLNEAINLEPSPRLYAMRGAVHFRQSNFRSAVEDFNRAIAGDRANAELYLNLAKAYSRLGRKQDAIAAYGQLLLINPRDARALRMRGNAHAHAGDYTAALRDVSESLKINPGDARSYRIRGSIYYREGEYQLALKEFDHAVRLAPRTAVGYENRAHTRQKLRDYGGAVDDYDAMLRLNPESHSTLNGRARALWLQGSHSAALADAERAVAAAPSAALYRYTLAHIYSSLGERQRAIEEFDRALGGGERALVRGAQADLVRKGYDPGAIDGAYGGKTRRALIACIAVDCKVMAD